MRCYCADAATWWRATANPTHATTYCSQVGRVRTWSGDRPPIRVNGSPGSAHDDLSPRETFNDGVRYGSAWPVMDGTAFVLESSFDFNRDR